MAEIAVVVRTLNEEAGLPWLLDDLRRQSERDVEVVVVDSGSTDRTRAIAASCRDLPTRLIDLDRFTYGRALNVGLAAVDSPLVAFLSAHVRLLSSEWLATMRAACEEPGVAGAFSRQVPWQESPWYERLFVRSTYGRDVRLPRLAPFSFTNAATMIRRECWRLRPFNEALAACEDYDWAVGTLRAGYRLAWVPQVSVRHSHDESFPHFVRRRAREGRALTRILRAQLAA